jgi:hypothetical protein
MATEVQIEIPPETGEHPRGRSHFAWIFWTVPTLLILYVLSTGPVIKLSNRGSLPYGVANIIYLPLVYLDFNYPPARSFFTWYIDDIWHADK